MLLVSQITVNYRDDFLAEFCYFKSGFYSYDSFFTVYLLPILPILALFVDLVKSSLKLDHIKKWVVYVLSTHAFILYSCDRAYFSCILVKIIITFLLYCTKTRISFGKDIYVLCFWVFFFVFA